MTMSDLSGRTVLKTLDSLKSDESVDYLRFGKSLLLEFSTAIFEDFQLESDNLQLKEVVPREGLD